jgi:hypothetical protein
MARASFGRFAISIKNSYCHFGAAVSIWARGFRLIYSWVSIFNNSVIKDFTFVLFGATLSHQNKEI